MFSSIDGDPTKNIGVDPISVYTKFLVNVRCTYDAETQSETSKYCPGYSDAMSLPFSGSKSDKLQRFSDVFCSRCQQDDEICRRLFCAPEYLLVDIAMALIESLCSTLSTEDSNCYNTFCNDRISKRSSNSETMPEIPDMKTNKSVVCVAVGDWSNIEGMDDWCATNCPMGNDDTCLVTYCDCRLQEETTTTLTTPSSLSLTDCSDWEASQTYSGVSGMTLWCQTVCRVGICPASHCQCAAPDTTSRSNPPTYSQTTSSTLSSSTDSSSTVQSTSSLSTAVTISPPPETTTSSTTHTVLPSTDATSNPPSLRTVSTSDKSSFGTGGSFTSSATSPSSTHAPSQAPATDSASTTLTSSRPSSSLIPVASTTTTSDGSPGATSPREATSHPSTKEPSSASSTSTTDSSVSTAAISLSTSEVPTVSSGPPLTTTEHPRVNETERMAAGLRVMSSVICKHTSQLGQTTITNRVCDSDTHDGNFESKGYTTEIIDRVLKFAPSLLCSFMSKSTNNECTNILCGQNPLIEDALKSSLCSVCRQLTVAVGGGCSLAYCTA